MPQHSKPGRDQATVRAPREHMALYREHAQALGLPLSDYITAKMAEVHGLDPPAYVGRDRGQLEMPMGA